MARLSVNMILGKKEKTKNIFYEDNPYRYSKSEIGEGNSRFPYKSENLASYKTSRDFEQAVGRLYKGQNTLVLRRK